MSKTHFAILFLFIGISAQAQRNYLAFDYSISQYKSPAAGKPREGISEKLNRCEGNYTGASFHFAFGTKNSVGIGMGISRISYQKEWLGTFPESSQFGAAIVNGQISYWSFPVSYHWISGWSRSRNYSFTRAKLHFGFSITYTPSFEGKNSFSANTSGGANLNIFLSNFQSSEQSFQHSLTVGFCDQLFLLSKRIRLDVEPYGGFGSGYFKESGTTVNTTCFGLRIRIGISANLPKIHIERESDKGNAEEKKKLLEQKQKEIQEQLNKNPK